MKKDWIIGFINGEGCFTFGICKKKKYYFPIFTTTLILSDLPILEEIKNILKVGSISIHEKQNSCTYQVTSSNVKKIIEYFDGELIGNKLTDFKNWKKGIKLWEEYNHKYNEDLANILEKLKPKYRNRRKVII